MRQNTFSPTRYSANFSPSTCSGADHLIIMIISSIVPCTSVSFLQPVVDSSPVTRPLASLFYKSQQNTLVPPLLRNQTGNNTSKLTCLVVSPNLFPCCPNGQNASYRTPCPCTQCRSTCSKSCKRKLNNYNNLLMTT